jgi:hypothetical protein
LERDNDSTLPASANLNSLSRRKRAQLGVERLEERTAPALVGGLLDVGFFALPAETNNVVFTPSLFLGVDDTNNPVLALPLCIPTSVLETLKLDLGGVIFGFEVSFEIPIFPFDLPGQALCPNFSALVGTAIAGFGGGETPAAVIGSGIGRASGGEGAASVVAGDEVPFGQGGR